jgi:ribosomal protein S2
MPSLICFFDINKSHYALREANYLNIPIVSLIDTDSKAFELVNYVIPSNNKGLSSVLLYLNVIRNGVIRGRQQEIIKILNLVRTRKIRKIKKFLKNKTFLDFLLRKKLKFLKMLEYRYKKKIKRL